MQLSCDYDTSNATRLQEQNFIVGPEIGFVSHKCGAGRAVGGRNWVCFAFLCRGPGWGRGKLGSFRVLPGGDWVRFAFLGRGDGWGAANWVRFG